MSDLFDEPEDATPLAYEERKGLIQTWITHRADLNEAEQANIVSGAAWAYRRAKSDILSEPFIRALHKRMFGEIWSWAGTYRHTERNIGIEPHRIAAELANTLDDVRYWVDHETYPVDEIAVRLHHRLVVVHPFPNGNGRHTRLMADLLISKLGGTPFTWGGASLSDISVVRKNYIAALIAADGHDIGVLLQFARS